MFLPATSDSIESSPLPPPPKVPTSMSWYPVSHPAKPWDVRSWFGLGPERDLRSSVLTTLVGSALYGASLGLWRGPEQALYVALKFPLLIFATTGLNALLNWLLSLVVGADLSFRETLKVQFASYAIASTLLLSLVPVSLFVLWNAPGFAGTDRGLGNSLVTLVHVVLIALAGIVGNLRLAAILRDRLANPRLARTILLAWLTGGLVVGAQVSWILRPFIGSPQLEIQFLRPHPLAGNFYTDVYGKWIALVNHKGAPDAP